MSVDVRLEVLLVASFRPACVKLKLKLVLAAADFSAHHVTES